MALSLVGSASKTRANGADAALSQLGAPIWPNQAAG